MFDVTRAREETIASTMQQLEITAKTQQVQVRFTRRDVVTVHACATSMALILRNILDNAIRYTPPGGVVDVDVGEGQDKAWLSVTDTGPGIDPEQRELLFQRFYRGAQQHVPGSGLGLSIVQRCVELHGGEIELQSPERGGLCVVVRLPKYQAAASAHSTDIAAAAAT